jgi:hypothetical protein
VAEARIISAFAVHRGFQMDLPISHVSAPPIGENHDVIFEVFDFLPLPLLVPDAAHLLCLLGGLPIIPFVGLLRVFQDPQH